MNNYPSPRTPGSTPGHEWGEYSRMSSATPTPSPRPNWLDGATPRRPQTRAAHTRGSSYSHQPSAFSPRPPKDSPRYNSSGQYATGDVSAKYPSSSSRDPPSGSSSKRSPGRDRRYSHSFSRSSTPYGESDEDEMFDVSGRTFVLPAQSRSRTHRRGSHDFGGRYTNSADSAQGANFYADPYFVQETTYKEPTAPRPQPPPQSRPPTAYGHVRRSSTTVPPPRSQTVRPGASNPLRAKQPAPREATKEDLLRHGIPKGYSTKNWDTNEQPILLLGSVFDANHLGKWIYDWTVYKEGGAQTPIADVAGDLWLLLIAFSGKHRRAEDIVGRIRKPEDRELLQDFVSAGERLMHKLHALLKKCEAPMLRSAKKRQTGLGPDAGVEFVNTLFGRDRELADTEKFMQSMRIYIQRFDANCPAILDQPTR